MDHLNKVVRNYLEAPNTDYAIMIVGGWGCGKSYYMHNEFADLARSIVVPSTKEKKPRTYTPAFISLYGLSSVEDFEFRVFSGVNAWVKKKAVRTIGFIGDSIVSRQGVRSDRKDIGSHTNIGADKVLVFDDFERICENKISIKEVLGLINTYSEHSKRKVVIICNESEFLSESTGEALRTQYNKYKENSVRFTYSFAADTEKVFDNMVGNEARPGNEEYISYLKSQKGLILDLYEQNGTTNLRTLSFFIESFEQAFQCLRGLGCGEDVLRSCLVTFLYYALEYKEGRTKEELKSMDQAAHEAFRPSPVLVDYVVSGYLDEEKLKEEIK